MRISSFYVFVNDRAEDDIGVLMRLGLNQGTRPSFTSYRLMSGPR